MAIQKDSSTKKRAKLLHEQNRRYHLVNLMSGFEDGQTLVETANFLVFNSAVINIHLDGPSTFIKTAEESNFSLAEFTAAKLSGFDDLDDFDNYEILARAFFSALNQNRSLELPSEHYVHEFINGVNWAVEQLFSQLAEARVEIYEA